MNWQLLPASLVLLLAQVPAAAQLPDPKLNFSYKVDGRPVHKALFQLGGSYDQALLGEAELGGDGHSLRLRVQSLKSTGTAEGLELWLHHGLHPGKQLPQRFRLSGQAACRSGEAASPQAEALYFRPVAGHPKPFDFMQYRPGHIQVHATKAEDQANRESVGFATEAPSLFGTHEGELVISAIDRERQIIEGHFEFDALRTVAVQKADTGEYLQRCWVAGDFSVTQVRVTAGSFRMPYCTQPANPRNSRYCQVD